MTAHPGAVVITIAAGKPGPHALTDWDARCGFREGEDAVAARRREDEEALKVLRARATWLEFLDHQYGPHAPVSEVTAAIEQAVTDFDLVASPLGLGHEDHLLTAAACRHVARRHREKRWVLYEDVIYRRTVGGTDDAIERLHGDGFTVEPVSFPVATDVKRAAIDAYPSQIRGLARLLDDAYQPERYWRIIAT